MKDFGHAEQAAQYILAQTPLRPRVALVLGSGLGAFADELTDAVRIPYEEIPHYPHPSIAGHAGDLVIGKVGNTTVAAMQGRIHLYEGFSAQEVTFPMRVFGRMGARAAVLTSAAGGINPKYRPGCLVVLDDHINLQGINSLAGPNDDRFGPRFPDMSQAYYPPYRELALREGHRLRLEMFHGVYAAMQGPSYETPAEIRYLLAIGADLVGMSIAAEVTVARHMGLKVLAICCVTNMAAGIRDQVITHEEVLETGERAAPQFASLLRTVIPQIAAE